MRRFAFFLAYCVGSVTSDSVSSTSCVGTIIGGGVKSNRSSESSFGVLAGLASGNDGLFYSANSKVYIARLDGTWGVVAGDFVGFCGDGKVATDACLNGTASLAVARNGDVYIADTKNGRIRIIYASNGTIDTLVGYVSRGGHYIVILGCQ
jgi:hypothetical protein